jgi:hypothetical protein
MAPIRVQDRTDEIARFQNWLKNQVDTAIGNEEGDVSKIREYNLNRYLGKYYGIEVDGKSKFTTREVLEAVEWAMPSIMKVFTSNERAVVFEPENQDDEVSAEQETDIANYFIQVENNGFSFMYNWSKDMLMFPNGYIKTYPEKVKKVTTKKLTGLTEFDLAQITENPNAEITEVEAETKFVEGFGQIQTFDLTVKYTTEDTKICIDNLPPEEVLISDDWQHVILDGCPFVAHRVKKSVSELVQMGYDADDLYALGDTDDNTFNSEKTNRNFYEEENPDAGDEGEEQGASKRLWVHEISCLYDFDGDDIAERRRVVMIGDQIFENEEDEFFGMVSCASIIIPHKHICMSLVEAVSDLQLLSTVLTRQMLDNVYQMTDKRHFINEDAMLEDGETTDSYLDPESRLIPVRGDPNGAVAPEVTSPITQELLAVIQNTKDQTKLRTGVAPELSLDANTLRQSTAEAFQSALGEVNQRLDLLIRTIAEIGYSTLMKKIHYLIRHHINTRSSVKIRGEWVQFDPTTWKERTKTRVRVGLGHNSNQAEMQLRMELLSLQEKALGQNLTDVGKIYNNIKRLVEVAGLGSANSYFIDPTKPVGTDPQTGEPIPWQPPQPGPDPQMILAEANAKALEQQGLNKQAEIQAKAQVDQMKAVAEITKAQASQQAEAEKIAIEREKISLMKEEHDDNYAVHSQEKLATIRKINEEVELVAAQKIKAEAEARKTNVEASDEAREAREIIDNEGEDDDDEQ